MEVHVDLTRVAYVTLARTVMQECLRERIECLYFVINPSVEAIKGNPMRFANPGNKALRDIRRRLMLSFSLHRWFLHISFPQPTVSTATLPIVLAHHKAIRHQPTLLSIHQPLKGTTTSSPTNVTKSVTPLISNVPPTSS